MKRHDIIDLIGYEFQTENIEKGEWSYPKAFKEEKRDVPKLPEEYWLIDKKNNVRKPIELDIRFENEKLSVLVETKPSFDDEDKKQLDAYVWWEKQFRPNNKIIAILADTNPSSTRAKIWKDDKLLDDDEINKFEYYEKLYDLKVNDKMVVLKTTNELNNLLHKYAISEKERSQFVGSCLVALNNGLKFDKEIGTKDILDRIKEKLDEKLDGNENKEKKLDILRNVLKNQDVRDLKKENLYNILKLINDRIIPYIREETNEGEDLLNLFFTTFNKYVGKADKNQAFTPTHITDFMSDLVNLNKDSRVLDITCGSGAFLIQAMKKMTSMTSSLDKKREIKSNQIFGIEREEKAFGLATTNMLIHRDGKSNIICDNCFDRKEWIQSKNINVILMNPPFNAQKMPNNCPTNKKGTDSTKGFYFVNWIADVVNQGYLCTILPLSCAIGTSNEIKKCKEKILKKHTLLAVFSLPNEIFYPGASASACIMLFRLNEPHNPKVPTFFGYYKNDGFEKRKNLGRVEVQNWEKTKEKWLHNYWNGITEAGISVTKCVNATNEWLAEAYMDIDYSNIKKDDFIKTLRNYFSYKIKIGEENDD